MILTSNSDTGFNNETKARSRSGTDIFLSENEPTPRWNEKIFTIAKIMKYVLSSAAEAEMGASLLTAKEMVPVRHTLNKMGWHQHP